MTETAHIVLALRLPGITVDYYLRIFALHFLNLLEMLFPTLALYLK